MQNYIDITELENGDLKMVLTAEGREHLVESQKNGYKNVWWELLEEYSCNGDYAEHNPADTGDLTDAPMVINHKDYEGDGCDDILVWKEDYHKRWFYADYQILDEFQELLTKGEIILNLVK